MSQKVLIVDDSLTVRQQVALVLRSAGFVVIEAADGAEGLRRIAANSDLALVISDVHMPRLGGLDMVEQARGALHCGCAILMLTTEGEPDLVDRARKAGVRGWMVKPFRPDHLVLAARKLCSA